MIHCRSLVKETAGLCFNNRNTEKRKRKEQLPLTEAQCSWCFPLAVSFHPHGHQPGRVSCPPEPGEGARAQRSKGPTARGQVKLAWLHPRALPATPGPPCRESCAGEDEAGGWAGEPTGNLGRLSCRGLAWSGDIRSGGRDKWRSVRNRRHGNWVR